jgi:hypothetical protein
MASAVRAQGLGLGENSRVGRNEFRFLGRTRTATKSLKGRLAVAQPPGATMAVTGKQFNTRSRRSKDEGSEMLTAKGILHHNSSNPLSRVQIFRDYACGATFRRR